MIEKYITILKNFNLKMGLDENLSAIIAESISTLSKMLLCRGSRGAHGLTRHQ